MPNIGPGILHVNSTDTTVFGESERDKVFFMPRNKFWIDVGEQYAEEGIGVNMFLACSKFVDIGSIGVIPSFPPFPKDAVLNLLSEGFVASITGGDIFFHPRFEASRDGIVLYSQMQRLFTRMTGYNCTMRVRCSNGRSTSTFLSATAFLIHTFTFFCPGLRISRFYGNFYQLSPTDLEIGTLDADKAISVTLEHSHSLDERSHAHVQAAVLYTLASGQRRVRVLNLALEVAALHGNVYRFADMDTVVCHVAREGAFLVKAIFWIGTEFEPAQLYQT
jgi:protein transport protein SEC24